MANSRSDEPLCRVSGASVVGVPLARGVYLQQAQQQEASSSKECGGEDIALAILLCPNLRMHSKQMPSARNFVVEHLWSAVTA